MFKNISKNMTKRVLWAQAIFLMLFAAFVILMQKGGLLTAYISLMGFAAGGAVVALLTFYHQNAMLGLANLVTIIGAFFLYAFIG